MKISSLDQNKIFMIPCLQGNVFKNSYRKVDLSTKWILHLLSPHIMR